MWDREFPEMPAIQTYGCNEPKCTRHYNADRGYFDVLGHDVRAQEDQRRCPNDGRPLLLHSISPEAIETWRCPLPDCTCESKHLKHLPFAHE